MKIYEKILYSIIILSTIFMFLITLLTENSSLIITNLVIGLLFFGLTFGVFFFIKKIQKKWLKILLITINTLIFALFLFFQSTIFIFAGFIVATQPETPESQQYSIEAVNSMTDKEYAIAHFPKELPVNIQNYFFYIGHDFHGYNIDYLKFNTNKDYIEEIIKTHKSEICANLKYKDISNYYKYIDGLIEQENKESYSAYILKNKNNDENYTSGFIASMETNEIIFFFANWNTKQESNKKYCN